MAKAGPRECRDVMRRAMDKDKAAIYNTARWRSIRDWAMGMMPLCPDPFGDHPDRVVPAAEVHHIVPLERDDSLAFDRDNVIPLCRRCHAKADALDRVDPVAQVLKMKRALGGARTAQKST